MERKGIYKSNKFPQRMREVFTGENGLLADRSHWFSVRLRG